MALPQAKLTAVDCLLAAHGGKARIVFTRDNRSAYEISRRFLVPAITCETGRREREQILEDFRAGCYRTLVSANVLNEGSDVPAASVALIAGGTGSSRELMLTEADPILAPHAPPQAVDSAVEARFWRDIHAVQSPWRLRREVEMLRGSGSR